MRILLAEDDAAFAQVLARALHARGHQVMIATAVAQALTAADSAPPEAAVIDLKLGDESGLALIEPLRRRLPQARLVVLTGYASLATAVEAVKRGADDYLAKPANADQILATLHGGDGPAPAREALSLRRLEWEHIQHTLQAHDGNISATARALGMHRRTLQRKLAKRPVGK